MQKTKRLLFESYVYFEGMVYLIAGILPPPIRKLFFKMMFANFGKNILLSDKLYVRYPWKVWIGDNVAIGRNAQIFPSYLVQEASVHIANGVVIAPNLVILGAGHLPEDPHNSNIAASVTIDENVYIGANVVIRYGVTIGKNSVLAAGSVVVSNVPPNSIYGGNPAKLIRRIDK